MLLNAIIPDIFHFLCTGSIFKLQPKYLKNKIPQESKGCRFVPSIGKMLQIFFMCTALGFRFKHQVWMQLKGWLIKFLNKYFETYFVQTVAKIYHNMKCKYNQPTLKAWYICHFLNNYDLNKGRFIVSRSPGRLPRGFCISNQRLFVLSGLPTSFHIILTVVSNVSFQMLPMHIWEWKTANYE